MTRIKDLLTQPTFADEDRTRTARLLHVYLLLNAVVNVAGAITLLFVMPTQWLVSLVIIVLSLALVIWVKHGYMRLIGGVGLLLCSALFYVSNFVTHSVFGPGTVFCLIFLAAAAFVYGRRGLWVSLALCSALVAGATVIAHGNARTDAERQLLLFDAATYLFIFIVFTFVVAIATAALAHALARAKTSERALRDINAVLEQRIEERTEQLAQSELHYRSLIENTSDMVSIVWPNGEVAYQSPSLEHMLGYKPDQVVGLNVFDIVHPDDVAPTQAILQTLAQADPPGRVFEARFRHVQGHWVFLEMTGKVIREGHLPGSIVITSRDVTERKQAAQIIQRQAESERLVADISDKFARMAPGQMDEVINHALQKMGEFVQADVCRLFLLEELEEDSKNNNRLANKHEWCASGIVSTLDLSLYLNFYQKFGWWYQQMLAYNVIHMASLSELPPELDLFATDLRRRQVQSLLTVPLIRDGQLLGEIGFDAMHAARDWSQEDIRLLRVVSEMIVNVLERERITAALKAERNSLEERVAERTSELSKLLTENARLHDHEVQAAALTERSRLARELHDSVSQALFGIVLGSRTLMQKAAHLHELTEPMTYVLRLAEAALAEMRALIFELRPESLQQEGLIAAFQKQAEALCARHQIEVTTQLGHIEPQLPIEAKEALYRIGLEAIQNTIKHAKATHVELNMAVTAERVLLEVCDDGIGFNINGSYPGHLGLVSMRERAEKCGGSFDISNHHGRGTTIRVQLPMDCACR